MFALLVSFLAGRVAGHGFLFTPESRQRLARDAFDWCAMDCVSEVDWCPHCSLAMPLTLDVDPPRIYPGENPFAEPDQANSAGFTFEGKIFGVCGTEYQGENDYNIGGTVWGNGTTVQTYARGETYEFTWCVNADHGGVVSYRLCDDASIIEKLFASTPMSAAEQEEAEACFQDTVLRCDDVPGNDCSIGVFCDPSWGCASDPGKYFHCLGPEGHCVEAGAEECRDGLLVKNMILIPETFPPGPTVMTWRWDSQETPEVYSNCADILIV
ncbi:hypothetical protein CTAYLR_010104 [Chrysophaeum taylorii]|uniref:Chitin-binding type-4 domain-containing protein n=1 Tax=Chrysophaeum taylorii TaxID=2483200 RepID=A0AAD7U5J8_9STRA|nr:hypothetical protein CTAYLR_010104 [Chrysophaeum taylorii]